MKKIIYIFTVLVVALQSPGIALAVARPEISSYYVENIDGGDWVELFCYKMKAEAAEAIASVKALNEVLPPLYAELQSELPEIGESFYIRDIKAASDYVDDAIETKTCGASSFGEVLNMVDEVQYSNHWSNVKQGKDKFKSDLTTAIDTETNKLKKEIESDIQKEADSIKAAKEAELNQKAKDLEAQKRAELDAKINEIKAKAPTGAYGPLPTKPEDIPAFRAQAEQEIRNRVNEEAKRIETEMRAQLDVYVAQFEAETRTQLEAKAQEIAGKKQQSLEAIKTKFEGIDVTLAGKIATYTAQYQAFEAKFVAKKAQIMKEMTLLQVEEAKKSIREYDEKIALAIENGVDMKTSSQLEAELDKEVQTILAYIDLHPNITEEELNAKGQALAEKWYDIQHELLYALDQSSATMGIKVEEALSANNVHGILQEEANRATQLSNYYEASITCQDPKRQYNCEHQEEMQALISRLKGIITEIDKARVEMNKTNQYRNMSFEDAYAHAQSLKPMLYGVRDYINETYVLQKQAYNNEVAWWAARDNQ